MPNPTVGRGGNSPSRASRAAMGPLPHVAPEAEPSAAKPAFVGMCDIYGDQHKRAADEHAYQTHRCTWRDMFTPKDGAEPDTEILEDIDAYLELFAAPILIDGKNLCPHCGHPFNGSLMDSFLGDGGFEWGLAHGEGHCRCCRWTPPRPTSRLPGSPQTTPSASKRRSEYGQVHAEYVGRRDDG
jgi:hypothetical protein